MRRLGWRAVARGEPLGVPSHAIVVHVPAALLPTSVLFDLAARVAPPAAELRPGALGLLGLGLLGGLAAAGTGLLDWTATIPGTPRRARVTRHLVVQAAALACFGVSFVLRLVGHPIRPSDLALFVAVAGTALLPVGNHLGGLLVYRDGMGVRIGR